MPWKSAHTAEKTAQLYLSRSIQEGYSLLAGSPVGFIENVCSPLLDFRAPKQIKVFDKSNRRAG